MPLAGLVVTWSDGRAHLFQEHFVFDSGGPAGLAEVLRGVSFP
jgi:hypothetical protein